MSYGLTYTPYNTNLFLNSNGNISPVLDPNAQAFITAAAITDATQQTAINNLVVGMKADGTWTLMTAIYPFVGGTATTHKWNLKDPRDLDAAFRLVFNGGWTHSSTGATPNGTNAYADTKFNLSVNYSLTSLAFGGYTRTSSAFDGGYNGTTEPNFLHSFSGYALAESFIGTSYRSVASGILGMMQNNVEGGNHKIYKNNTLATSIGATITSLPNKNMFIGSAGLGFYNNHQLSFYYYSNGLTDTDAANLYTRVQAFQTSLSRQV